jgi:hypothetical protein
MPNLVISTSHGLLNLQATMPSAISRFVMLMLCQFPSLTVHDSAVRNPFTKIINRIVFLFFLENVLLIIDCMELILIKCLCSYNIVSMCCVGRKSHRKKVTINFFHIYYQDLIKNHSFISRRSWD